MTLLFISFRNSVDRAPAQCSGGHGFVSCRELRLFLCPTFESCWLIHFSHFIIILISPSKRPWRRHKDKRKHNWAQGSNFFSTFSYACAYVCVCAATSENEIPFRHYTSTRTFTTLGQVWPMKTLDPDYLAPKQFGRFGWFCLCLCLCRISF